MLASRTAPEGKRDVIGGGGDVAKNGVFLRSLPVFMPASIVVTCVAFYSIY